MTDREQIAKDKLIDDLIKTCKYSRIPLGEISSWDGLADYVISLVETEIKKAQEAVIEERERACKICVEHFEGLIRQAKVEVAREIKDHWYSGLDTALGGKAKQYNKKCQEIIKQAKENK